MESLLRFRGREITAQDAAFIRTLITSHPGASRYLLSKKLCEAWDWRQPNGSLRDMVCRSLMLALHRAGHIKLPPPRFKVRNPLTHRKKPAAPQVDQSPVQMSLKALGPLTMRQVRRTDDEALVNGLVQTYHYLGYTQPVGEHLKFGSIRISHHNFFRIYGKLLLARLWPLSTVRRGKAPRAIVDATRLWATCQSRDSSACADALSFPLTRDLA